MWVMPSDSMVSHDKNVLPSTADSMLNRAFITFSLQNGEYRDEISIETTSDNTPQFAYSTWIHGSLLHCNRTLAFQKRVDIASSSHRGL